MNNHLPCFQNIKKLLQILEWNGHKIIIYYCLWCAYAKTGFVYAIGRSWARAQGAFDYEKIQGTMELNQFSFISSSLEQNIHCTRKHTFTLLLTSFKTTSLPINLLNLLSI